MDPLRNRRLWVGPLAGVSLALAVAAHGQEKVTYQDHVLPLIENNCAKCHNPDKKKGDLDLTSYNGVMKGGGSGPVVAAGNPDSSKLWKAITHAEDPTMPPNKSKLPDKELDIFKKWIAGGLLETSGSKAITASKAAVELALTPTQMGKPEGPPPMPEGWSLEPIVHTARGNPVTGLAASPWAPLIALAGQKQVLLYQTEDLELLGLLPFPEGEPVDLKFSRNGKLLLAGGGVGGKSGRVLVWDVISGERLMTIGHEYDTVLAADMSPDQSRIALGGPARLLKIYSTKTGEMERKIKKHTDWITAVSFSPNSEWVASADRNGGISLWDPDNGQELFTLAGHKSAVTALSWRDDSKLLASSSEDGAVKLWEMQEGKQAKTWTAHSGGTLSVSYAHDGRLITCGRDNQVTLWDASGSKVRSFEFFGQMALRAAFSADGTQVFATDFLGRVAAWKTEDGKRRGELDANPLPLADRIAATQKRIEELQTRGNQPSPELRAAEAEQGKINEELAKTRTLLEQAKTEQSSKEADVVHWKEMAAKATPPADIQAQLSAARAERFKARQATTNATQIVARTAEQAKATQEKVTSLAKAADPVAALAEAKATLTKLKAAQLQSATFQARETLAKKKPVSP
jgi:hypothetical protein